MATCHYLLKRKFQNFGLTIFEMITCRSGIYQTPVRFDILLFKILGWPPCLCHWNSSTLATHLMIRGRKNHQLTFILHLMHHSNRKKVLELIINWTAFLGTFEKQHIFSLQENKEARCSMIGEMNGTWCIEITSNLSLRFETYHCPNGQQPLLFHIWLSPIGLVPIYHGPKSSMVASLLLSPQTSMTL